MASCDVKINCK